MTFTVGDVLSRSLRILFANFVPFALLAAIVWLPTIVLGFAAVKSAAEGRPNFVLFFAVLLVPVLLGMFLTGALTYGVFQQMRGRPASIGSCVAVGIQRLLPVLGVGLVTGLLIGLGVIALIIPGIILMCMWWVAIPAAVIENVGVGEAMRRSASLTAGHRWTVFFIVLVMTVINAVVQKVVEILFLSGDVTPFLIATYLASIPFAAWTAAANAVAYHDLRAMKEHVSIEDIAAVFD